MMQLYIANKNYSSWSLRPWVLMRELDIPFEERLVPFGADADFRAFSPSGKVPCLIDNGTVVWDSLAITEYLAEREAFGVWPQDRLARAWARCAAAEMHSGFALIRNACGMNCALRVRLKENPAALVAEWTRVSELWVDGLTRFGGPFLAGSQFTAVDAFYAPVAFRVQTYEPQLPAAARAYVDLLLGLPAMRAWYQAALEEPWRDEEHEAEARHAGTILHDFRAPA